MSGRLLSPPRRRVRFLTALLFTGSAGLAGLGVAVGFGGSFLPFLILAAAVSVLLALVVSW